MSDLFTAAFFVSKGSPIHQQQRLLVDQLNMYVVSVRVNMLFKALQSKHKTFLKQKRKADEFSPETFRSLPENRTDLTETSAPESERTSRSFRVGHGENRTHRFHLAAC